MRSSAPSRSLLLALICLAVFVVSGCTRTEPHTDLLHLFTGADCSVQTALIDVGTPAGRSHLGSGWSWDEESGGMSFAWGLGEGSEAWFFLVEAMPLDLVFRCLPFRPTTRAGQQVMIELNGTALGSVALPGGISEQRLAIPREAVHAGRNRLRLRYARSEQASERDPRQLAVGWDWIRLDPLPVVGRPPRIDEATGDLLLPGHSQAGFFLRLPPGSRLRLQANAGPMAGGDERLLILWQVDGEAERQLAVLEPAEGMREIELPHSPEPVRIGFRLLAPPEREWRIGDAMILAPPSTRQIASSPPSTTRGKKRSVILYLVDTLRADALGAYGQQRPLTPHLDRLAREALFFEQARAQTSWTKPAVASILTGLEPLQHGVNSALTGLDDPAVTLAEQLTAAGFHCAAFVANSHITAESGFAQGFETFRFSYAPADELTGRALAWLDRRGDDTPFFLFIHTVEPHAPYQPPEAFRRQFAGEVTDPDLGTQENLDALADRQVPLTPDVQDGLIDLYQGEVACADEQVGRLLEGLADRGLYENSVVAFLSDHGEAFYEHGVCGHGWDLHREVLAIPFLLRLPGVPPRQVSAPVEQVDLLPTLLDYLGLPVPPELPGRNLLARPGPAPRLSYMDHQGRGWVAMAHEGWKVLEPLSGNLVKGRQLYRLSDEREERDLVDEFPVMAGYLASLARLELASRNDTLAKPVDLDSEHLAQLQALGYLE